MTLYKGKAVLVSQSFLRQIIRYTGSSKEEIEEKAREDCVYYGSKLESLTFEEMSAELSELEA